MDNLKKYYTNKNVLITGGASFIGSHLAEYLVTFGSKIKIIDNLSSGKEKNLSTIIDDIEFIEDDVRNEDTINKHTKNIDYVFNLAAMHGGRGYIETHPVESVNNMVLDHIVFSHHD